MFSPTITLDESTTRFLERIRKVNPRITSGLIPEAYQFSWYAHRDQQRRSGEPFLAHPVAVSMILAEQGLDPVTIAAGLLHDVLEDTPATREKLTEQFGEEVALLVDGVTKIGAFQMKSVEQRQAETYRKMLLSMARDPRVIIIKFADRLHNLRTLRYLPADRIQAIANETLDIYAPLAHRLGMARIEWELEDLAFKHLHPKEYKEIVARVVGSRHERERIIDSFVGPLRHSLEQEAVHATVIGRPKHLYSIYRKMVQRRRPFEEIYDLLAIRVITDSVRDCYHTLGIIHSRWKPVQDRFKDHISTPKSNGYQSLHTTLMGDEGHIVEMQIRTWEMNQIAEDGVAAHWRYKDGEIQTVTKDDKALVWLKNVIEWQKDLTDSSEFFEFFKVDLFHAEIFVFTPKGELITLPKGATVLDFAFAVHTELGLHCIGAKANGKIQPISKVLHSGDTVEILHLSSKKPSTDWLRDVKTPKARSAIRRWLKSTGRQESVDLGRKIVKAGVKKLVLPRSFQDHLPALLTYLGIATLENMYEQLGNGVLSFHRIQQYFETRKVKQPVGTRVVSRLVSTFTRGRREVLVGGGADNIMVRFARCCNPIPGDNIIGFVTKGRGISVHRKDCPNASLFAKDRERSIMVSWQEEGSSATKYDVLLDIVGNDRPGLLHDITGVLAECEADIVEGTVSTDHEQAHNWFRIEIKDSRQLKQILRRVQRIRSVVRVFRTRDRSHFGEGAVAHQ